MENKTKDYFLNKLKGKIWLAIFLLAAFNCVWGLIAYIASNFISTDILHPFVISGFLTTATTVVFGRWIANEVLRPIEKVNLLAKSMERNPAFSLPKTTGSSETDELLQTLHRNSQQLQNLIGLMDDVAAGRTETALTPLANSDRLCSSFQKLVSKVTDSIDAKKKLDALETAVYQIGSEVEGVQIGKLIQIRSDFPETRKISDALRSLVTREIEMKRDRDESSAATAKSAGESHNRIRAAAAKAGTRLHGNRSISDAVGKMSERTIRMASDLSLTFGRIGELSESLDSSIASAKLSGDAVNSLRKQIGLAAQKIQKIHDSCNAISDVSKSTQDLVRRSRTVALNTSIQLGSESRQIARLGLSKEIDSIPARAEKINDEISRITESLARAIDEAQGLFQAIAVEITKVSRNSVAADDVSDRMKAFLIELGGFAEKFASAADGQSGETQELANLIEESSVISNELAVDLRSCEETVSQLLQPSDGVPDLRVRRTGQKPAVNGKNSRSRVANTPVSPEVRGER